MNMEIPKNTDRKIQSATANEKAENFEAENLEKETIAREQERREKINVIEDMPIAIDKKVELLLVLAGEKSAADIELFGQPWIIGETAKQIDPEIIANIKKGLGKLGFAFEVKDLGFDHIVRIEDDRIPRDKIKPENEIHLDREKITIEVAYNIAKNDEH